MHAAVLHAHGQTPRYESFPDPIPQDGEALVAVRAASLKTIDKMRARGDHYDRYESLPVVCGVDGVGTLPDGQRVYFGAWREPFGSMAERSVTPAAWTFPLPDAVDDATAAALPNPGISSWLALTCRANLSAGETVLVLGATGVAGRLAVQIAKLLGAGRVIAAGRDPQALEEVARLGADTPVALGGDPEEALREAAPQGIDIVLDYLWGEPAERLLAAFAGQDLYADGRRTRWVQIGESAGASLALPAGLLRSSGLELLGSGGGSIPRDVMMRTIGEAMPRLFALATAGKLQIATSMVPLADVATAWDRRVPSGTRLVFVP